MTIDEDFFRRPVHGPTGRISTIRKALGLTQAAFAREVGTTRETVSHWENLNGDGNPRQRTTRRNAETIAKLARDRLGLHYTAGVFFGLGETATDLMRREQLELAEQQQQLADQLHVVLEMVTEIRDKLGD